MEESVRAPANIDLLRLLSSSWTLFTQRPGTHVLAFLLVVAGGLLTLGLAAAPLMVGYLRVIERLRQGESAAVGDVLEGLSSFAPAFIAGLIAMVGVVVGSALVVLPGVVVAVVWSYALWFVALERQGAIEALGSSWAIARRHASALVLVLLAVVALNFVGGVLVIGVLVTGPVTVIFMTYGFAELRQA